MTRRILVVGAGATGGFFGAQLAAAGRDVTFLVRPRRAEELARVGLTVVSDTAPTRLERPRTVTADHLRDSPEPFDLIILACKAFDLDAATTDIAPAVGPGSLVLPLLNGLRHLEQLDERFGADAVLGGSCFVSARVEGPGDKVAIHHRGGPARVTLGARGALRRPVEDARDALAGAEFEVVVASDVVAAIWSKWVFLSALVGIATLVDGSVGEAVDAGGRWLTDEMLLETAAIAADNGFPQSAEVLAASRRTLGEPGSALTPSLLSDLRAGRRTEAEHIVGDLLGRRTRAETGLLDQALLRLRVHEARLPSARDSRGSTLTLRREAPSPTRPRR